MIRAMSLCAKLGLQQTSCCKANVNRSVGSPSPSCRALDFPLGVLGRMLQEDRHQDLDEAIWEFNQSLRCDILRQCLVLRRVSVSDQRWCFGDYVLCGVCTASHVNSIVDDTSFHRLGVAGLPDERRVPILLDILQEMPSEDTCRIPS